MLFNSWLFVFFFFVVYWAYLRLSHREQNTLLLIASYAFYATWDWRFLGLILLSTGIDYVCGRILMDSRRTGIRRACVAISVTANLGMLGVFKYFDFFAENLAGLLEAIGLPASRVTLGIVVPVGISFYTFQTMSYTIDLYRGQVKACRSLRDFALFVAFFPQLVAGPIERARNFLPQIREPRVLTPEQVAHGLWWVLVGYFLKVYMADNLAPIANRAFADPWASGTTALLGVYAFTFQIYGDFAGYSLIARGVAKLMGFDLSINFRMPYLARTPSEFWTRWHISLSSWLRDYLYIPLGGNRRGVSRTFTNLVMTMLLGGLWHGAEWKFVIWGAFHGALLIAYRLVEMVLDKHQRPWMQHWVVQAGAMVVFFHCTVFGWIIFRCESLRQIVAFPYRILTELSFDTASLEQLTVMLCLIGPVILLDTLAERLGGMDFVLRWPRAARWPVYATVVLMLALFGARGTQEFIYFQF